MSIRNRNYNNRNMVAPVVALVVSHVDISSLEGCLLGIRDVRKKLLASHEVKDQDLHIEYVIGIGFSYMRLTKEINGVEEVEVGYPVFESVVYAVLNSFTYDGMNVTDAYRDNKTCWIKLLRNGLASLIVITLEPCRSKWVDENVGRLIMEHKFLKRTVLWQEGYIINKWDKVSLISREQMENNGPTWRNNPFDAEDIGHLLEDPIYARAYTAVRSLE
ncbi:hypothetical protein Tco_0172512 [Tanacetum coccineum]